MMWSVRIPIWDQRIFGPLPIVAPKNGLTKQLLLSKKHFPFRKNCSARVEKFVSDSFDNFFD